LKTSEKEFTTGQEERKESVQQVFLPFLGFITGQK
jgi:hypothetical protein